jgi:putative peptidoglycan lipid II flippase
VLAPAFYSRQDTATPVRIAVIAMVANMVLNIIFVLTMLRLEFEGPHAGLALATSVAAYLNAGLLYRRLRAEQVYTPGPGWRETGVRILVATLLLCLLLGFGVADLTQWPSMQGTRRTLYLGGWILVGAVLYLGVLRLQGEPLGGMWRAMARERADK